MLRQIIVFFLLTLSLVSPAAGSGSEGSSFIHHDLQVTIVPDRGELDAHDTITLPAGSDATWSFSLHEALTLTLEPQTGISLNRSIRAAANSAIEVSADSSSETPNGVPLTHYELTFTNRDAHIPLTFTLHFSGRILQQIQQQSEEYERSFSETSGIISAEGVYLGGSSFWIPSTDDEMLTFDMTVTIAARYDVVSQGSRLKHAIEGDDRIVTWESLDPMEEIYLVAGPWTEFSRQAGQTMVMAFLRSSDSRLAETYLETTASYLTMYQSLIGPYPFTKFALVENFWETGYGMPSFTLLGPKIIRFPFILHSSYPHELLHNWWGNSVYVDAETGNWCEGLTAYLADHLIKEQRGGAIEYRRTTLQKFTDYVKTENDFPLEKFTSRTHAASEAIGYGKAMMMWHMLRRDLGDAAFIKGLQEFYRNFRWKQARFADLESVFAKQTDKDLHPFFEQWLTRRGAVDLSLTSADLTTENDQATLTIQLTQRQKEDPFIISVPVLIYGNSPSETLTTTIPMTERTARSTIPLPFSPRAVIIDPTCDVFRLLDSDETPPTLSKAFGSDKVTMIMPSAEKEPMASAYQTLAETWSRGREESFTIIKDSDIAAVPDTQAVWIVGFSNRFRSLVTSGTDGATFDDTTATINSSRFDRESTSFIICARHPKRNDGVLALLVTSVPEAIPGLARKLPHYGKYSYLVFDGSEPENIEKGTWPVLKSPLIKRFQLYDRQIDDTVASRIEEKPLCEAPAVYSADALRATVTALTDKALKGRGNGTPELEQAAIWIASQFRESGLKPVLENENFFQRWKSHDGSTKKTIPLLNVIGVLPGEKKSLADEAVVLCAHFDHLGSTGDSIYFGADDNASGVAVLIELARNLSQHYHPDRTILFVAFSGEESGRKGSQHFLSHLSDLHLKTITAAINLDTVGRLQGKHLLILGASTAREWRHIIMGCSYVTGLQTDIVQENLDASDQASFHEAGIPAIQLTSGPHLDYHKPTDTPDKIDVDGLITITAFTSEAITYLAEREEPLTISGLNAADSDQKAAPSPQKKVKASIGIMPDFAYQGKGVRIAEIVPSSPAATSGLNKGDVITTIDGTLLEGLKHYATILATKQPGDSVKTIIRSDNGTEREITVILTDRSR